MNANVCFRLLDEAVVRGRGDEEAVEGFTFAQLLEEVAAVAGVLAAVGAAPGERVLVDLADDRDAVTVALAVARLGAVLVVAPAEDQRLATLLDATAPTAIVSDRAARARAAVEAGTHRPGTLLLHGEYGPLDDQRELAWDVALRAGRTDPAPCVMVSSGNAFALTWEGAAPLIRSVGEQVDRQHDLTGERTPGLARWRASLLGG